MIAVDTTGAIIGEPPPSLEAPPVDMVSDSRPKIINEDEPPFLAKFIIPDPNRPIKEINRKTKEFVKNMGKGFLKIISGPGRYLNHKIFPSYVSDNVKIPEYDRPIPENLKDNWITYADIPEENDIKLFENHPKLHHWTWKTLSWFPHRYNVALNSRDYHDSKIRSAKENPIGKILDVPAYYGNAALGRLLYAGNKAQDLATDPVGTVWTDPVLSDMVREEFVDRATTALENYAEENHILFPDMEKRREKGWGILPYKPQEQHEFRKKIFRNGLEWILDNPNTEELMNPHRKNAVRAIGEINTVSDKRHWTNKQYADAVSELRRKYATPMDVIYPIMKSYDIEHKRTKKMYKQEREKILFDNYRHKLEKDDMEKPIGQTAVLTAGALGFMGGGGGGSSVWGNWKRGRKQTWFNKYGFRTNRRGKVYHRFKRLKHNSWKWHY